MFRLFFSNISRVNNNNTAVRECESDKMDMLQTLCKCTFYKKKPSASFYKAQNLYRMFYKKPQNFFLKTKLIESLRQIYTMSRINKSRQNNAYLLTSLIFKNREAPPIFRL